MESTSDVLAVRVAGRVLVSKRRETIDSLLISSLPELHVHVIPRRTAPCRLDGSANHADLRLEWVQQHLDGLRARIKL